MTYYKVTRRRCCVWFSLAFSLVTFAAHAQLNPMSPVSPDPKEYIPGNGFDLYKGRYGSINLSSYALLRYLNQLPANQTFVDHLGREQQIDTRHDIQLHRILIHLKGFLYTEKLRYQSTVWAVNSTNSVTAFAVISYEFAKEFMLSGGIGALPGTRSLNYQHPYFLGTDRQMADEFFRPSFTSGVWASGELPQGLKYRFMVGDNLNIVDISAAQLTRDFAFSGTVSWFPTTGEFGPKEGYGDFEMHDKLATRFGVSGTHSREDRFTQIENTFPDNTTIRLSDSLPLFQTGSLAAGTTIQKANYTMFAADASLKYRGFFLFGEVYHRHLSDFESVGPVPPLSTIDDTGIMIQASYMIKPQKFEIYGAHSQLFGEFNHAWELTGGLNYYPFKSRNFKINGSVTYVDRSPVSSLFGYFVGGQKGPTIALSTDFLY